MSGSNGFRPNATKLSRVDAHGGQYFPLPCICSNCRCLNSVALGLGPRAIAIPEARSGRPVRLDLTLFSNRLLDCSAASRLDALDELRTEVLVVLVHLVP